MSYGSLAAYLDDHPAKRAAIEHQIELYEQERRNPWARYAGPDGLLRIVARRSFLNTWQELPEPAVIHKDDAWWLEKLWQAESALELKLWQAGIGRESIGEPVQ